MTWKFTYCNCFRIIIAGMICVSGCKKEDSSDEIISGESGAYLMLVDVDSVGSELSYGIKINDNRILVSGVIKSSESNNAFLSVSHTNGELDFNKIDETYVRFSYPDFTLDGGYVCLGHLINHANNGRILLVFDEEGTLTSSADVVSSLESNLSLSNLVITKILVNQQGEVLIAGSGIDSSTDAVLVLAKMETNGTLLEHTLLQGTLVNSNFNELSELHYVVGRQLDSSNQVVILNNQLIIDTVVDVTSYTNFGFFDIKTRPDISGFYVNLSKLNNDGSYHSGGGFVEFGETVGVSNDGAILYIEAYFDKNNDASLTFNKYNSPGGTDDSSEPISTDIDEVHHQSNGMYVAVGSNDSSGNFWILRFSRAIDL